MCMLSARLFTFILFLTMYSVGRFTYIPLPQNAFSRAVHIHYLLYMYSAG
jgi:hypothetical protein